MPSNGMTVCLDCRVGSKGVRPHCLRDSHKTLSFGTRITVPKKNNARAWKRIEKGEYLWDRRKVRTRGPWSKHRRLRDTIEKFETEDFSPYPERPNIKRRRIVEESRRETVNYDQLPNVDLGG